jgi:hypothetical protein
MPERIAVIGNCQSVPIAAILSKMCPRIRVEAMPYTRIKNLEQAAEVAKALDSYDLILIQDVDRLGCGPMRLPRIAEKYSNVVQFPAILFSGFHPDFIIVERGHFLSAASKLHSLIVAAAYFESVPEEQVRPLFNSNVFKVLGYFEVFEREREALLSRAQNLGYDFARSFETWKCRGIFMLRLITPSSRFFSPLRKRWHKRPDWMPAP